MSVKTFGDSDSEFIWAVCIFADCFQVGITTLELLEEFWSYLPNRYPSLFRQLNTGLENLLTGEVFVFRNCAANDIKEDPMLMAGKMVQDDFAIMMEGPDGNYYLKAGAIILPGFWRFKGKYGMSLNEIHESGHVPKYKEKLQTGMTKFFTRLTCEPSPAAHSTHLNALVNTQDIYFNSAHSSQSSLQSLLDSNRHLDAASVHRSPQGTPVKDGIKGFSDELATHLFSYTNETTGSLDLEPGLDLQIKRRY